MGSSARPASLIGQGPRGAPLGDKAATDSPPRMIESLAPSNPVFRVHRVVEPRGIEHLISALEDHSERPPVFRHVAWPAAIVYRRLGGAPPFGRLGCRLVYPVGQFPLVGQGADADGTLRCEVRSGRGRRPQVGGFESMII